MFEGLKAVSSHRHRRVPENSLDRPRLRGQVEKVLKEDPDINGLLRRKHGLYTWGGNLNQGKLHLEILGLLDGSAWTRMAPGLPMRMGIMWRRHHGDC
jgi:hypothetical protein